MMWSRSPQHEGPRIGYVLKKYPRVSETFVLDEILALEAAGVDLSILSLRLPDDGRFHPDLSRVRATVDYLPGFSGAGVLAGFESLSDLGIRPEQLARALDFARRLPEGKRHGIVVQGLLLAERTVRHRLGHLHAHFMTVAAHAAYLAHLFTSVPFTVTAHAKDVYRHTVDPAVFREVARAATAVVTVCEANRRYLAERVLAGAPGRVVRVYNGVPLDEVRRGPGRDRDPRLIAAVGRLVEKKGFAVLLSALRLLADRGVEFRCVLAGTGDQREALLARRRRLGLEDRVELPGALPRQDVLALMDRARVLAAPCVTGSDGNRDALPTVLLEALAMELPVVTTPVGGIPEIVEHERHGLLVPEHDPTTLAAALERLLTDQGLWSRCARRCREKATATFDRARTAETLLEVFAEPAPGAGAAPPRGAGREDGCEASRPPADAPPPPPVDRVQLLPVPSPRAGA
jgi:colanic acid/amylovoran biosynthesis glycosyltransferase